jgi:hypothetical protein
MMLKQNIKNWTWLSYACDRVLLVQTDYDLQRLLYKFKQAAEKHNMKV